MLCAGACAAVANDVALAGINILKHKFVVNLINTYGRVRLCLQNIIINTYQ